MKSLQGQFTDWVNTKPRDEEYNYFDAHNCAVGQFGREMGFSHLMGVSKLVDGAVPKELYLAVHAPGCHDRDRWTFGALADRLAKIGGAS